MKMQSLLWVLLACLPLAGCLAEPSDRQASGTTQELAGGDSFQPFERTFSMQASPMEPGVVAFELQQPRVLGIYYYSEVSAMDDAELASSGSCVELGRPPAGITSEVQGSLGLCAFEAGPNTIQLTPMGYFQGLIVLSNEGLDCNTYGLLIQFSLVGDTSYQCKNYGQTEP